MHILNIVSRSCMNRWPFIEAEVQRVVKKAVHGEFTAGDVKKRIEEGKAFAVYVLDGDEVLIVCVWELIFYPRLTAVNIMCLGGRDVKGLWHEFEDTMRKVWKSMGATAVECSVSPAMSRLLQKSGFIASPLYVNMRGDL